MNQADKSLLIIVGLGLVLLSGLGFFGLRPLYFKVVELRKEQNKVTAERTDTESRAETLASLAKSKTTVEALGIRAETYLPKDVAASQFLLDIEVISREIGLSIPTVSFQGNERKLTAGLVEHPTTLTADGTFEKLRSLLSALEGNLRFSNFSSLTVNLQKEVNLSLQITGVIYSKLMGEVKDKSLTIDEATKNLLNSRRPYGGGVNADGSGRANPFAEF